MNTIQFHIETGMLAAVLDGCKTQTVRSLSNLNTYHVGDILAVVEPYVTVKNYKGKVLNHDSKLDGLLKMCWKPSEKPEIFEGNPDTFPADLARNFVKITGLTVKKPCEFTEAEFEAEGVAYQENPNYRLYYDYLDEEFFYIEDMVTSFLSLIQAIYGAERGAQLFESEMLVLTFERCDRDGKEVVK